MIPDNIKLKKGMTKEEVNELISEWITLEDEKYISPKFEHNWKCKCGNIIKNRRWENIYYNTSTYTCDSCKHNKVEQRYRYEVEKDGDYEYIRSYRKGETLPDGRMVKSAAYIQIRHKYCGNIYETASTTFINKKKRCGKCCQKYENSFAYHIEVELGEPLEKYWDFEKNTVNPYHISKTGKLKVWIKCQNVDYHESYETTRSSFIRGRGCPYCASSKIHPKDSFAQYHIDNTDSDFLDKYWDWDKNNELGINPWEIAPRSNKYKVWIKCQNEDINELNGLKKKDYHGSYEVNCSKFTDKTRCPNCYNQKISVYDSFGYHHFDKVLSWHPDNEISPFRVSPRSGVKYKFICKKCEDFFETSLDSVVSSPGMRCPKCRMSKGEGRIDDWLIKEGIIYVHDEPYFKDLISSLGNPLRPDFILPKHKIWIEYDGEFHFEDIYKNGSINLLKYRDKLKDEYAKKHGWKMIRIPYWDFDNIEKILEREIKDV